MSFEEKDHQVPALFSRHSSGALRMLHAFVPTEMAIVKRYGKESDGEENSLMTKNNTRKFPGRGIIVTAIVVAFSVASLLVLIMSSQ